MKDLYLAEPSKEYQKSFENYALAYKEINDEQYFNKRKSALENFDDYLCNLQRLHKGIELSNGEVAVSTFWLVDNGEVVGTVRVRHKEVQYAGHIGYDISPHHRNKGYGTKILKLALEKASAIGITEAIVTCKVDNIASRRIIEKNNGRLLERFFHERDKEYYYKYAVQTNA